MRSQFATSNAGRGGRRYLPYAFTEHGVAVLSSVLAPCPQSDLSPGLILEIRGWF